MTTVGETYVENRRHVQPTDTNNYGSAHGGIVVKQTERSARYRRCGMPARPASSSRVYEAGRTSVEVPIRAFREAPRIGDREQMTGT